MRRVNIKNIITERELQVLLLDLENRWKKSLEIKNSRKRFKEIMKIRDEARQLLSASKEFRLKNPEQRSGWLGRCYKKIASWLSSMERRYK